MTDLILHHYDASPFSQKAQKILGIKGLDWRSVEMPMAAPKPDIEALTGGYRGTPVLQIGSDIFIDTVAIADALDYFYPKTPRLVAPSYLVSDAMGLWADALFEPVLRSAVALYAQDWDAHFYNDRAAVFPHLDFAALPETRDHMALKIVQSARLLDDQLADGRAYLDGDHCSLADVHCWGILWFVRSGLPEVSNDIAGLGALDRWFARVSSMGAGSRLESDYEVARAALAQQPINPLDLPGGQPRVGRLATWWDTPVAVCAVGADRGCVRGTLLAQGDRLITLRVEGEGLGVRQVHFPSSGYEVSRV